MTGPRVPSHARDELPAPIDGPRERQRSHPFADDSDSAYPICRECGAYEFAPWHDMSYRWSAEVIAQFQDHFQPRYIAYAAAHGRTPDDMIAYDADRYPGGIMAGFILWIGDRWREWRAVNGRRADDVLSDADYASFDRMIGA